MKFRFENLLENGNKNRLNLPGGELLLSLEVVHVVLGKKSLHYLSFIVKWQ